MQASSAPSDANLCVCCCNPESRFLTLNCIAYHLSSSHEFTAQPQSSSSPWWWHRLWWCCWWTSYHFIATSPQWKGGTDVIDEVFSRGALASEPELSTSPVFEMIYLCIAFLLIWLHRIVFECIATYLLPAEERKLSNIWDDVSRS